MQKPRLEIKHASDIAHSLAQALYEDSRNRFSFVSSKASTLLALTGISISGTIASLSLIGVPQNPLFYSGLVITAFLFSCTCWLLFKFLGIGTIACPHIDQDFLNQEPEIQKKVIISDLLSAADQNNSRNDFLIDVYKTGRRLCMASIGCAIVIIIFAIVCSNGKDERILLKLRSDPKLLELLRGPQGLPGQPGSPGPKGDRGEKGSLVLPTFNINGAGHKIEKTTIPASTGVPATPSS